MCYVWWNKYAIEKLTFKVNGNLFCLHTIIVVFDAHVNKFLCNTAKIPRIQKRELSVKSCFQSISNFDHSSKKRHKKVFLLSCTRYVRCTSCGHMKKYFLNCTRVCIKTSCDVHFKYF